MKHYYTTTELKKDIASGVYDIPDVVISPQDWLVLCSKIDGARRCKTLKQWEFNQCRNGKLSYCLGKINDTIIFRDVNNVTYHCKCRTIPEDWDCRFNVIKDKIKQILPLYKLHITNIENKQSMKKEVLEDIKLSEVDY